MLIIQQGFWNALRGISKPEKPLLEPFQVSLPTAAEAFFIRTDSGGEKYGMNPDDEKILRLAKEIVIKFIELGRVSPTNFEASFKSIFWALKNTVVDAQVPNIRDEILSMSRDDSEND